MKTSILLFFVLIQLQTVNAQTWLDFGKPEIILIGIDRSGSLKAPQKAAILNLVESIITTKAEKDVQVFVIPIHANTGSAAYMAHRILNPKKGGRSGKIELKRLQTELIESIQTGLETPLGNASQWTDIVGFWARVQEIQEQTNGNLKIYLISDMIHETPLFTFETMSRWVESGKTELISEKAGLKRLQAPVKVSILQPEGIMGSVTTAKRQEQKRVWTNWLNSIHVEIEHWDSVLYE